MLLIKGIEDIINYYSYTTIGLRRKSKPPIRQRDNSEFDPSKSNPSDLPVAREPDKAFLGAINAVVNAIRRVQDGSFTEQDLAHCVTTNAAHWNIEEDTLFDLAEHFLEIENAYLEGGLKRIKHMDIILQSVQHLQAKTLTQERLEIRAIWLGVEPSLLSDTLDMLMPYMPSSRTEQNTEISNSK